MVDLRSTFLFRSTVDRSSGTPGFGGFQITSQQISRSVTLVNSRSGVDQWSSASQHPMTDIYYGTLGFRSSGLSILSILQSAKSPDCCSCFQVQIHMTPGMPRGDPCHPGDIIIPCHIRCFFGTSWLWDFGASGF
jgi:hypothetical protein